VIEIDYRSSNEAKEKVGVGLKKVALRLEKISCLFETLRTKKTSQHPDKKYLFFPLYFVSLNAGTHQTMCSPLRITFM
jgi:hypothetical protein